MNTGSYFSYYNSGISGYSWESGEYYLSVNTSKERLTKSQAVENFVINAVNSCVNSNMTEKEAVIAINNYVCNCLTYQASSWDIYDAITTKKGNCMSYAELFYLMCRQCGITCEYIEGNSNQGYHAWNRVYISGNAYWVDTCWNDTSNNKYLLSSNLWDNHSNAHSCGCFDWQRDSYYN